MICHSISEEEVEACASAGRSRPKVAILAREFQA